MTDRPIIFSAPMVRALLAGQKTQTRRLASSPLAKTRPGDRLWVRESVVADEEEESGAPLIRWLADDAWALLPSTDTWHERHFLLSAYRSTDPELDGFKPVPAIHMPRWASRLTLMVTDVCLQRLHEITEADAIAEGMREPSLRDIGGRLRQAAWSERQVFARLWEHLHGPGSWDANHFVVALTFTVAQHAVADIANG